MTLFVAVLFWALLNWGFTYVVTRAEITEGVRIRIVARVPVAAWLLSCRACTSFWTAQAAAAVTMGIVLGLGGDLPWHSWLYLPPTAGFASLGLIDLLAFMKGGSDVG